ncbi:MAG: class I SAM-dependent methyltransferase [Verrucomicrobiales bacterium]|nr:class I SAM-dependent methyltransferase [Verrucomicrobiales bacterium]
MSTDPRTPERIRHHFEVERELAGRMRNSSREERTELFKTLYTELFERVPDHPRLTRRDTEESSRKNIESQMRLLRPFLSEETVFLEMASGDCRLSFAACEICEKVIGVDISDQRNPEDPEPENFELIVYDGDHLEIPDDSVDVAFSYQFLEHLHPDDVVPHFETILRILKPGGIYLFDSPHRFSGPHDVSRFFGDELQCFHFQEWSYREMLRLVKKCGFSEAKIVRRGKALTNPFLIGLHQAIEAIVGILPSSLRRRIASRLFQSVTLVGTKPGSRSDHE